MNALIRPFRALRPEPPYAALVAAPPYDVLSLEEAREFARKNPLCFLHVEKPEIDVPLGEPIVMDEIVHRARQYLAFLQRERILVQDPTPAYYLYGQRMGMHRQYGIVALASVRAYEEGVIKRHEFTRADKEEERTQHVDHVGAHAGPVFLAYRHRGDLDHLINRYITERTPEATFTTPDGVLHQVWQIANPEEIEEVTCSFTTVPALYIADGHHRAAAAARVARLRRARSITATDEHEYFLAVLFPHNQLQILPYHRIVRDLNGLREEAFLAAVAEHFRIVLDASARSPRRPHEFGMYLRGKWYRLTVPDDEVDNDDPISSLDVSLLQDRLLGPILGIQDPRRDERIDFVGGIRGPEALEERVNTGQFTVAFALYPVLMEQLMAIADAGAVMPPNLLGLNQSC